MNQDLPPSERPPEPPRPPRTSWEEEKMREKEAEKEQEKEAEKPGFYQEKIMRSPLSSAFWAGILIWAGVVFLAETLGYLPAVGDAKPWDWIFFGAGVLLLLEAVVRSVSPDYRRPAAGRYIGAGILMVIGLSGLTSLEVTWPLILLLVGVAILANSVLGKR